MNNFKFTVEKRRERKECNIYEYMPCAIAYDVLETSVHNSTQ